jgi:hypothetical protein
MNKLVWRRKFRKRKRNYKKKEELGSKARMISIPMLMT